MAETNCARWPRESVPVWLREKGCEAPAVFRRESAAACPASSVAALAANEHFVQNAKVVILSPGDPPPRIGTVRPEAPELCVPVNPVPPRWNHWPAWLACRESAAAANILPSFTQNSAALITKKRAQRRVRHQRPPPAYVLIPPEDMAKIAYLAASPGGSCSSGPAIGGLVMIAGT
jgi:hypothetical protein